MIGFNCNYLSDLEVDKKRYYSVAADEWGKNYCDRN